MYAVFNVLLVGQDLVDDDGLADDLADRLSGVQRSVGILEDDLHILAQRLHIARVQLCDILAVEDDLAGGRLNQAQNTAARRGFAAAGFTDHAKGLAFFDGKGDVVHRMELAARRVKVFFQVLDLEQFLSHLLSLLSGF